jgi:hypothetical protein
MNSIYPIPQKRLNKISKLSKLKIDEIFAVSKNSGEALYGLYQFAPPKYDKAKQIRNYPQVSRNTARYILDKFHECLHPDEQTNLLWLNIGFSTSDHLPDWTVDIAKVIMTF